MQHLEYLQGEGLIRPNAVEGVTVNVACLKLTAKGMACLMDGGGLGTPQITVRFEDDVYRRIQDAIMNSGLSPQEKRTFRASLERLPSLASAKILEKLLDAGLDHLLALLRTL